MTIRHLKIFITVADCGKMRRAAEILYISQPSVSQAIKELEQYYGVKLFERLSQRIYITDEGKLLLSYARHIVNSFESMDDAMKNASHTQKLHIGASVSVGTCMIDDIVTRLENKLDGAEIFVTVNNTSTIENMLCKNEIDIGIVEGTIESPEIIQKSICKDELVMVCGRSHPFFTLGEVRLSQLENQAFISREAGSYDRNQFEKFLGDKNISVVRKWNCTNTEAIKNAVISGKGIAILSRMLVKNECEQGLMKILNVKNVSIEREIKLVYHKNKYVSEPMRILNEILT